MTDDIDAEIKIIQQRMTERAVARCMADGMTEADARATVERMWNEPPPIPLPTFEELDGSPMSESEKAKLVAWLMTDPLAELTNVITAREIVNTDDLLPHAESGDSMAGGESGLPQLG
jgi:hypothetical protein